MNDDAALKGKYFQYFSLAEGVYAAIAIAESGAFGNCAIVDSGDHTIVFDTSESPASALELKDKAESLTDHPVSFVIISHAHPDHVFGTQVFDKSVPVISTLISRQEIFDLVEYVKESKRVISEWEEYLSKRREELLDATDEKMREHLGKSVARIERSIKDIPQLELRIPTVTFKSQLVIHGSQRDVVLTTNGAGHTASDSYVLLPDEKILLAGDLAFFQRQPYMGDCNPAAWVVQIEKLLELDPDVIVPGHGEIGGKADLLLEKEYLQYIELFVKNGIESGLSIETIMEQPLPAPFYDWSVDGRPSEPNVRFIFDRQAK
jgi:glyoxylase-like metal-dependent hydrolase (beta-lactamase superfamily II)